MLCSDNSSSPTLSSNGSTIFFYEGHEFNNTNKGHYKTSDGIINIEETLIDWLADWNGAIIIRKEGRNNSFRMNSLSSERAWWKSFREVRYSRNRQLLRKQPHFPTTINWPIVVRTTTEIARSECVFYEGRAVVQRTSLRLVFINKPHANARRTSNGNVVDYGVRGYPVNVSNNFRVCYCLGFFESIQPYRHTGSIGKRTLNRGFVAEEKYQTESHIEEIIRP